MPPSQLAYLLSLLYRHLAKNTSVVWRRFIRVLSSLWSLLRRNTTVWKSLADGGLPSMSDQVNRHDLPWNGAGEFLGDAICASVLPVETQDAITRVGQTHFPSPQSPFEQPSDAPRELARPHLDTVLRPAQDASDTAEPTHLDIIDGLPLNAPSTSYLFADVRLGDQDLSLGAPPAQRMDLKPIMPETIQDQRYKRRYAVYVSTLDWYLGLYVFLRY
jgi:hypothetical protein